MNNDWRWRYALKLSLVISVTLCTLGGLWTYSQGYNAPEGLATRWLVVWAMMFTALTVGTFLSMRRGN